MTPKYKSIFVILVMITTGVTKAQPKSQNIWDVTHKILVDYGERDSTAYHYPRKTGNKTSEYPYFIFANDKEIEDSNAKIPNTNNLEQFLFGTFMGGKTNSTNGDLVSVDYQRVG